MRKVCQDLYLIEADEPGSHSYWIRGEDRSLLIDPGLDSNVDRLRSTIEQDPDVILNTHEHFDHVGGNKGFQDDVLIAAHRYAAVKIVTGDEAVLNCRAHPEEFEDYKVHLWLENNALIDLGNRRLKVLHTPGHTSGSLCVYDPQARALITGDMVFAGGGVSDVRESGSYGEYANSLSRLYNFKLDLICPGHGELSDTPDEDLEQAIDTLQEHLQETRETNPVGAAGTVEGSGGTTPLRSPQPARSAPGQPGVQQVDLNGSSPDRKRDTFDVPREVRDHPLDKSPLAKRSLTALKDHDLQTFGDLREYSREEILDLKGVGEVTLEHLEELLQKIHADPNKAHRDFHEAFSDTVEDIYHDLSQRNQKLIRLWSRGELTQEEIGERFGVSKQRVEQIKNKFLTTVEEHCGDIFRDIRTRLEQYAEGHLRPFTREELVEYLDPEVWGEGMDPEFGVDLLCRMVDHLPLEGRDSGLPADLADKEKQMYQLLRRHVDPLSPRECYRLCREDLDELNVLEWISAVQQSDRILSETVGEQVRLRPRRVSTQNWVVKLLEESDEPLHENELARRYGERFEDLYGPLGNERFMANANQYEEVLRFDSQMWGLPKHLRLGPEEADRLRDHLYKYVKLKKGVRYMAYTGYMAEWLNEHLDADVDGYELAILLRNDDRFRDLGRMVFTLTEGGLEERVPLKKLILEAMEKLGVPVKLSELVREVGKKRSVRSSSLSGFMREKEPFHAYGKGYYGDCPLDELELSDHPVLQKDGDRGERTDSRPGTAEPTREGVEILETLSEEDLQALMDVYRLDPARPEDLKEEWDLSSVDEVEKRLEKFPASILTRASDGTIRLSNRLRDELEPVLELETGSVF